MCDHEKAKLDCVRILEYYGVYADTEYTIPTRERIDVVGYDKDRRFPDIGIEVECSSTFQHDAQKLVKVQGLEWKFVLTDQSDTLSLGEVVNVDGKNVYVYPLHELDLKFEKKIREITGENNRPWYNNPSGRFDIRDDSDPCGMGTFIKDLESQGLNVDIAKDIVFKAAMGGINVGYYRDTPKIGTEFHGKENLPKELHYLTARAVIFEARIGYSYADGKQSIYYVTRESQQLAKCTILEHIKNNREHLKDIVEKFGAPAVIVSLLGNMGKFVLRTTIGYPDSIFLPGLNQDQMRYTVEHLNIQPEIVNMCYAMAMTRPFLGVEKEIYEDFVNVNLGTLGNAYDSKGRIYGQQYTLPMFSILENVEIEIWKESLDVSAMREYAIWALIPGETGHTLRLSEILISSLRMIGADKGFVLSALNETFDKGITSKPSGEREESMAVYKPDEFKRFREAKMAEALSRVIGMDI